MTKQAPDETRDAARVKTENKREGKHHEKAMEDTFPASDPPATSQPGSGITGPEVIPPEKKPV